MYELPIVLAFRTECPNMTTSMTTLTIEHAPLNPSMMRQKYHGRKPIPYFGGCGPSLTQPCSTVFLSDGVVPITVTTAAAFAVGLLTIRF